MFLLPTNPRTNPNRTTGDGAGTVAAACVVRAAGCRPVRKQPRASVREKALKLRAADKPLVGRARSLNLKPRGVARVALEQDARPSGVGNPQPEIETCLIGVPREDRVIQHVHVQ